jgi:urease accessory protein
MRRIGIGLVAAVAIAPAALAHPGHEVAGFAAGFGHPWAGVDHLLAMIAIGIAAAHQQTESRWRLLALPAAFVVAMAIGAALGFAGDNPQWAEAGIALSLVAVAGLIVARKAPLGMAILIAALCGLPHGAAHAAEMPSGALADQFMLGFLSATALLHALGVGLAAIIARAPIMASGGLRWASAIGIAGFGLAAMPWIG